MLYVNRNLPIKLDKCARAKTTNPRFNVPRNTGNRIRPFVHSARRRKQDQ